MTEATIHINPQASLAVRVVVRAPDRTLSPEDVQLHRRQIIDTVVAKANASLRGEQ